MRSINLKELAILSDTALLSDPVLLEKFKSHNRVLYNKGTDLYSYKVIVFICLMSSIY